MSMKSFQDEAKTAAKKILKEGYAQCNAYKALYAMLFPKSTLSAVTGQFADPALLAKNATLEKKLGATLDALADISENLASLEEYLQLNIPQMEDGNNFGVTVQLSAQAILKHAQEDLGNDLEDLLKYKSSRAEALEKCKLPSKSTTISTTVSESESKGNTTKEGDATSKEAKQSKESKTTESMATDSPEAILRVESVQMVDVIYHGRAKAALRYALMGYMNVLQFFELNAEKIDSPKGSRGSGGAYASMY